MPLTGDNNSSFEWCYLGKASLSNFRRIHQDIGLFGILQNSSLHSSLLHIRSRIITIVHTIHPDKGTVKVQLVNLVKSNAPDTSICRHLDTSSNHDSWNLLFNQLSGMVNRICHNSNILINQFMNQKSSCCSSIDKDDILFLDERGCLLSQQLLFLKVFDRFFLNGFFFLQGMGQFCSTMHATKLVFRFQLIQISSNR